MHHRQTLRFIASLTVCPSDIRKIQKYLTLANPIHDPIQNILITPLFANKGSLKLAEDMRDTGRSVMFDSGGYYVQTGRITYESLYYPLLDIYRAHRWASTYVLPDHVPTSQDKPDEVEYKVERTLETSEMFFHNMPDDLKDRAMPVVHGHTQKQIDACLKMYISMGVNQIGFGSFGTMGANSEVNVASKSAVDFARYVIEVAHAHKMKVHLFGLGVPAIVAMLKGIGADSFDSSSWLKSAGFGQVFLPFMRAHNITYKNVSSELQRGIKEDHFLSLKQITGHACVLCDELPELRRNKMYRAVHNLIVLSETIKLINDYDLDRIQAIYKQGSPKYRDEVEKWLVS